MDNDNNNWLAALANKQLPSDDPEHKMAQQLGKRLRGEFKQGEVDENELNKLLQRLKNEGLLRKKTTFSSFWRYGLAAGLALAISVPVLLINEQATQDYPVMRGMIETLKIHVSNPEASAIKLQSELAQVEQQSQIFKRADNYIVVVNITKFTPGIRKVLEKNSISLNKSGVTNIEFSQGNSS